MLKCVQWFVVLAALPLSSGINFAFAGVVPNLQWIEPLPGDTRTNNTVLSGDGRTVAVNSIGPNSPPSRSFLWTVQGGAQLLPVPSGYTWVVPRALNFNGSSWAGFATTQSGGTQAMRWESSNGNLFLSPSGGTTSSGASGISPDGAHIVGGSNSHSVEWNFGVPLQLPDPPMSSPASAGAVSADGNTVVGAAYVSGIDLRPFKWTAAGGSVSLPTLNNLRYGEALALTPDGLIAVGTSGNISAAKAVRWTPGGIELLGTLSGTSASIARGVSADGSVIVGDSGTGGNRRGFVWTASQGMVDVNTMLTNAGINLGFSVLVSITGVSANGLTIAGTGSFVLPSGVVEDRAWIATIPAPGSASVLLLVGTTLFKRRRGVAGHR